MCGWVCVCVCVCVVCCGVGGGLGADLQSRVGRKPSLLTHAYHAALGGRRCYVVKPRQPVDTTLPGDTRREQKSSASNTHTHTHTHTHITADLNRILQSVTGTWTLEEMEWQEKGRHKLHRAMCAGKIILKMNVNFLSEIKWLELIYMTWNFRWNESFCNDVKFWLSLSNAKNVVNFNSSWIEKRRLTVCSALQWEWILCAVRGCWQTGICNCFLCAERVSLLEWNARDWNAALLFVLSAVK